MTMNNSTHRIKGSGGVIIDSERFLELPKAPLKVNPDVIRAGMIRYNKAWKAFEGALEYSDGSLKYNRFAHLDDNGKLLTSQLPDYVVSGLNYKGTYDPVIDDVDPPRILNEYHPLEKPSANTNGYYFIVRGLFDQAVKHFIENKPTKSPVVFTPPNPSNPSAQWIEIKYYFKESSEFNASSVTASFGRVIKSKIPASGHDGLLSLAKDNELGVFDTKNNIPAETALADGDWILSANNDWIRNRSHRTSILSSEVYFDERNYLESKRIMPASTSPMVQSFLDAILMTHLQRTGDSMYDSGDIGSGRLALVYGNAKLPAISFNNKPYDPSTNNGTNPTQWSDSSTGLYRLEAGGIGLSVTGTARLNITDSQLTFFQNDKLKLNETPSFELSHPSNTSKIGLSAFKDIFYVLLDRTQKIEISKLKTILRNDSVEMTGNATVYENLTVRGNAGVGSDLKVDKNTILGTSSANNLTVNATSNFNANADFKQNVTIEKVLVSKDNVEIGTEENKCSKTLTVFNKTSFNCDVTINDSDMNINGSLNVRDNLNVKGNTVLGTIGAYDETKTVSIAHKTNIDAPTKISNTLNVTGNTTIGTDCKNETLIKSKLTVSCDVLMNAKMNVKGISTFDNNATINKNLTVVGETTLTGITTMKNNVNIDNPESTVLVKSKNVLFDNQEGSITIDPSITMNNISTFNKNIFIKGNTTVIEFNETSLKTTDSANNGKFNNLIINADKLLLTDKSNKQFSEVSAFGLQLPLYSKLLNTEGVNGAFVRDDKDYVYQKKQGKWVRFGTTLYYDFNIKREDWKFDSENNSYYIKLQNKAGLKILSIQTYMEYKGALKLIDLNNTLILKDSFRLEIFDVPPFNGCTRIIYADDPEDYPSLEISLNQEPLIVRVAKGTSIMDFTSFEDGMYFKVNDSNDKFTTNTYPNGLENDSIISVYNAKDFTWKDSVLEVISFGETVTNISFMGLSREINITPVLPPQITTLDSTFKDIHVKYTGVERWDTSNIKSFNNTFENSTYICDITTWNVSNANSLKETFKGSNINQDLSAWETLNIVYMNSTFENAGDFVQDISSWLTLSVENHSKFDLNTSDEWTTEMKPKFK